MTTQHTDLWSHILTLMTAIIVVDNHIHKAEIETFLEGADDIAEKLGVKTDMTRGELGRWFQLKREDILARMHDDFMDSYVVNHIIALEDFSEKEQLIDCLQDIAIADQALHETEKNIIQLACAYWGLPLSRLKKRETKPL